MKARRNRLRWMGLSAIMAAILCVLSPITLPMGIIPITLSVFALFLVSALTRPKVALTATAVYLFVGAVGLPVFSSFTGGAFAFVSPSGGFLWGYLPTAFVVSFCSRKGNLGFLLMGFLSGLMILYLLGMLGFCILTGAGLFEAFLTAVLPFVLPDAIKLLLALFFVGILKKRFSLTV